MSFFFFNSTATARPATLRIARQPFLASDDVKDQKLISQYAIPI